MPIIKLGGPQKFSHLKKLAPTLRTTALTHPDTHRPVRKRLHLWVQLFEVNDTINYKLRMKHFGHKTYMKIYH